MRTIDALVLTACCALLHSACSSNSKMSPTKGLRDASVDAATSDAGGGNARSGTSGSSSNPGSTKPGSSVSNDHMDGGKEPPLVWNDGGIGDVSKAPASCDKSVITISFAPMYSAYDGVHLFQIPATVVSIDPSVITWGLADPEIADLAIVPNGVMLTIQKPGTTTLIASAGTICGTSKLTVTEFDPTQWEIGSARYNNGEILTRPPGGPPGAMAMSSGEPIEAACTSCHGESATNGVFQTIAHTPAQTGGFSDDQLFNIITKAMLPDGAYFDEGIVSKQIWMSFHKWKMAGEQQQGIIAYLRSLTPSAQTGQFSFANLIPDGGFRIPDGGAPAP